MAWSPHPPVPVALTSGCSTSGTGVLLVGSRRAPAEAPRRKREPMRRSGSGRPAESLTRPSESLTRFRLGLDGRRADGGSAVSAELTPDARADAASQRQRSSGGNAVTAEAPRRKHEAMRRSGSGRPAESLTAGNARRCGAQVQAGLPSHSQPETRADAACQWQWSSCPGLPRHSATAESASPGSCRAAGGACRA